MKELNPIFVEFMPDIIEDGNLYVSIKYKVAIHNCVCGCKEKTVTPFGNNGWTLSVNNDKVTLRPSIGNFQFDCKSHYYITDNQIQIL